MKGNRFAAAGGRSRGVTTALWLLVLLLAILSERAYAETGAAAATAGEQLFKAHCESCHSGFLGSRAPSRQTLARYPSRAILQALTTGQMRVQGYSLSGDERRSIAEYISGVRYKSDLVGESRGRCADNPPMASPSSEPEWNGWGNSPSNSSSQSAAAAAMTVAQVKSLKLKWAFGFPDSFSAWSQPVVASERVFIGSQAGIFYSLAARSGCTYWQFKADAGVRSAASVVALDPGVQRRTGAKYGVLFGDMSGRVYALNANTGELLWKVRVESHPLARITGSPVAFAGRYFVPMSGVEEVDAGSACCTFRGSLSALDVATGKILWKTHTIPTEPKLLHVTSREGQEIWGPSGSAVWTPPLLDRKRALVYVGTSDSYTGPAVNSDAIIAFDMETGAMRWSKQLTPDDVLIRGCERQDEARCHFEGGPNYDIGSPPMMVTAKGKDLIVVGQKSGVAYALDPDRDGAIVWRYRAGEGGINGGIVWGSAALGTTAYFPVSDITSARQGGLHAVDVTTGTRVWVALPPTPLCGEVRYGCSAAQPVGIGVFPGVLFAGSVDGGFRAYSSDNGALLWQYDTNRDFATVNEVAANGGSLIGSGPTIVDGMVFVNSGYGMNGGRAGNVLLAFGTH
jgi:polyvinyl alcohol dehydrogenase (cytochrome)